MNDLVIKTLLKSEEPSIRYLALTRLSELDPTAPEAAHARQDIAASPRILKLLSERASDGRIPGHPYSKWQGAHWVLALLADLGYPPGDQSLVPLREQVFSWLLGQSHTRNIKNIAGQVRRCASQEGNALFAMLSLGLADDRCDELASRLVRWQWPDGGWNCDINPAAINSSFHESLIPLRALHLHAHLTGSEVSRQATARAAEIFLKRRMFRRQSDRRIMDLDFVKLHFPCYWHYDFLFGLKVMAETGFIHDPRCQEAIELLKSRQLKDGGFPADAKYYRVSAKARTGRSLVDWGGTSQLKMNPFVTVNALYVLKEKG